MAWTAGSSDLSDPGELSYPFMRGVSKGSLCRTAALRPTRRHSATASFDHMVAAGQECRRDVDGKRPRGLEVAGKLELRVLTGPRRTAAVLLAVRLFSSANAERRVLAAR